MDQQQLWYRGNNLVPTAFLGALAIGLLPEIPQEGELLHYADDVLVALIGLGLAVWYFRGGRVQRSIVPVVAVVLALAIKVVGLILEFNDAADRGDEFGSFPA